MLSVMFYMFLYLNKKFSYMKNMLRKTYRNRDILTLGSPSYLKKISFPHHMRETESGLARNFHQ